MSTSAATPPAATFAVAGNGVVARVEVVSMRRRDSSTYRLSDGSFEQVLSRSAMNFKDESGAWAPIVNELEETPGGGYENAANSFRIDIPSSAADAVGVESDGRALSFELLGANESSTPTAEVAEAMFADALPYVDVTYEAKSTALKETLTLDSRQAPRTFTFRVDAGDLKPRLRDSGELAFVDQAAVQQFAFAAPWMQDAAGVLSRAAHYVVRSEGTDLLVDLQLDENWLDAPERSYPVMVDPTVYEDAYGVCELVNGRSANVSACSDAGPAWIGQTAGKVHRAAIALPAPELPYGAVVVDGELAFDFVSQSVAEPTTLDLYALTKQLGPGATWNVYDPGSPWDMPGGDGKSTRESRRTLPPAAAGQASGLAMHQLVQGWVDETEPSHGILVRSADEVRDHVDVIDDVQLRVRYQRRMGIDDSAYAYQWHTLSDGTVVGVHLGNGNLVVAADDFGLDGLDDQLALNRYYNSKDDADVQGAFGIDWRGDFGTITLATNPADGSIEFNGPTGRNGLFVKRPDGTFAPPPGTNATLVEHLSGGGATLTYDDSGESWVFDDHVPRRLIRRTSSSGAADEATYDTVGRIVRAQDADGNTASYAYDLSGRMRTIVDQYGDLRHYDYDTAGHLIRYTDASGAITAYTYDRQGLLQRILMPDRSGIYITYYSEQAVETVTLFDVDDEPTKSWEYSGSPGETWVESAGAKTAVHHFDRSLFNFGSELGTSVPSLTLSGDLYDHRDTLIAEGGEDLHYSAMDANGIAQIAFELDGEEYDSVDPNCTSPCTTVSGDWSFDATGLDAGSYNLRVTATDGQGNQRSSAFRLRLSQSTFVGDFDDPDPAEPQSEPIDLDACAARVGAGSVLCDVSLNSDPSPADPSSAPTSVAEAATPTQVINYGLAQDFHREPEWVTQALVAPLKPRYFRRIIGYNITETTTGSQYVRASERNLKYPAYFTQFETLYDSVYRRGGTGGEIVVSFGRAHCDTRIGFDCVKSCSLSRLLTPQECLDGGTVFDVPSYDRYRKMLRGFFAAFPRVHVISPWNEPNNPDQPLQLPRTGRNATGPDRLIASRRAGPGKAAHYALIAQQVCDAWRAASRADPKCTVLAGEFAQRGTGRRAVWISYARTYLNHYRSLSGGSIPRYWAFHPYIDARQNTPAEQTFKRAGRYVSGTTQLERLLARRSDRRIWFTEVGSRIDMNSGKGAPLVERRNRLTRQSIEVAYLYGNLARTFSNIEALFYYSPFAVKTTSEYQVTRRPVWDSALIGARIQQLRDPATGRLLYRTESYEGGPARPWGVYDYGGLSDPLPRPAYCIVEAFTNPRGIVTCSIPTGDPE